LVYPGKEQPFERGITCSAGSIDHEATTSISGGSSLSIKCLIYNIISNKKGEKVRGYGLWFISSANDEANNDPRT